MSQAEIDVLAERQRHIFVEGFDEAHDEDGYHIHGELAIAGACYAIGEEHVRVPQPVGCFGLISSTAGKDEITWPWDEKWYKPKNRRRDLVRAAALIIAEIDRIDRIEKAG
jgi:hypothetical protein